MKHKLSVISILLAVMAAAASCGSETQSPNTITENDTHAETTAETAEPDRLDELGEADFGGAEFWILDATDNADSLMYYRESMIGDIVNDRLGERDTAISDRYNVSIKYETITNAKNGAAALKKDVMAGNTKYQLVISTAAGGALETLATDHVLANLCEVPYLKLDAPYWSRLMYENIRLDQKMYFTSGDISPNRFNMAFVTYLNQKLLADFDIGTDFYGLVNDGKWTYDALYDLTKDSDADLNNDGKMHTDDDFFGLATQCNELVSTAMLVGAGVSFSSVEGDQLTVNLNSEAVQNTIEKIQQSVKKISFKEQNDIFNKAFKNDRALAIFHITSAARLYLRDMESDYMILPMPKFDEAQDGYRSYINVWVNAFIGIPNTADLDFAGRVTEALDYWSYRNIRPVIYNLVYKEKAARDVNSQKMLDIVFDNLCIDFNCLYNFGDSKTILYNCIYDGQPLASNIQKNESAIAKAVTEFAENWRAND